MEFNLEQSAQRIISDLQTLDKLTSDENGAQRVAWTPMWEKARNWFLDKAQRFTSDISKDAAGNLWLKYQGLSEEAVIIGSHLDSVPNGGWLDGALGVLSGLEVLRYLKEHNITPQKTIYLVDWSDEEGARYGYSCLGSSAASGSIDIKEFIDRKDAEGIDFQSAIQDYGIDIDTFAEANQTFKDKLKHLVAYLEFHIEQGPVLEDSGKNVSCVYGAAGVERHYIDFAGQSAHAGSFPTEMRQDAFLAAASASIEFRKLALKYDAVCTVGEVELKPNVVTIIPGTCTISLDMRTIDPEGLQEMLREAQSITEKVASEFGCKVNWRKIYNVIPQLFDEDLVDVCKSAVQEEVGETVNMYSGPLHDAVEMNKHIPTVMMFVMSKNGISHDKGEDTPLENLTIGIRAYLRLVSKVIS